MPDRPAPAPDQASTQTPRPDRPELAGVVLAGGRSSRLHRSAPTPLPDKPLLRGPGGRLLDLCLEAVTGLGAARGHVVVVGPPELLPPAGFPQVREDPPFSGPAQAVRAGLRALDALAPSPAESGSPVAGTASPTWVVLLAADMPHAASGLSALLRARDAAKDSTSVDGWVAVAEGHRQPLLSLLRRDAASRAFADDAAGASLRSRLGGLRLEEVAVPAWAAADVDTWEDALSLGFVDGPVPASTPQGEDLS